MRNEIPPRIASLSREMDQLFNRIPDLKPAARAMAENRLEALDAERKEEEAKLAACARRESALGRELDSQWVVRALADLEVLWERMTDVNRGRLVAALVARVVVDERRGEIAIVLVDDAEAAA